MFPSKRKIYAGLAGVGITLGAAGLANAASSTTATTAAVSATAAAAPAATAASVATTPTDPTAAGSSEPASSRKDPTPSYTSSVTIAAPADGSEPTAAELQAVATVTSDQATAAALVGTPGTAGTAELKSVAGNVVWEVDVTATAGGSYDVIVDAGDATILDTHAEGGHGGGGPHGDATPSYTSSVTIAVPADGSEPTAAELQAVATVTADQATAAAIAGTPGTAGTTELESVAGNVVWEVDVTATAGGSFDVILDAGNATILDTHVEGGHAGGGGHHDGDGIPDADSDTAATTTTG